MTVGGLNKGAGGMDRSHLHMISQRPCDEGRSQVDGNGREPDHNDSEENTRRGVQQPGAHVICARPARPWL